MSSPKPRQIMLIAGEASGDTLGAELVAALKEAALPLRFFGAGGTRMASTGVDLAFDLTTHAVVGIWEVLKNYGKFKKLFDQLLALARERRPEIIILIDYPGFNLRFAAAVKKLASREPGWNPKVVFYVSPQIWAWHESRIHQIARDIDLLLSIFPFEKAWYAQRKPDFKVEFVGHPLVERYGSLKPSTATSAPGSPLLLLLPGSRVRELRKHLPAMIEATRRLQSLHPNLRARMILPNESLKQLAHSFAGDGSPAELKIGGLAENLSQASLAIASSGTVTMECAWFGVPTVVLYKTSASTHFLGRRFISVKFLAMPNLLADKEIYPEFIQDAANPENLTRAASELLSNESRRQAIQDDLRRVMSSLGAPGAASRGAKKILELLPA